MLNRRYNNGYGADGYPLANHASFSVFSPPAIEPISLDEAKAHLNIDFDTQDALLAIYIQAARERMEEYLRRSLITQTRDLVLDWGPAWFELPFPPVQSLTALYSTDLANVETLINADTYHFNATTRVVALNLSQVWPLSRAESAFRARYVAGYGATPEDVPASIRLRILNLISYMYDSRQTSADLSVDDKKAIEVYRVGNPPFRMSQQVAPTDILA